MFFILKCHGRGESGLGLCTTEGMQSQKGLKHEESFVTQPNKKNSPGRMAQTPQTGSNDSVGRSCRYGCSILLKCDSHLAIFGTSLIKLLPPLDKFGLLSTPKKTYNLNSSWVQLFWEFGHLVHQQRCFVPKNCTIMVCFHPLTQLQDLQKHCHRRCAVVTCDNFGDQTRFLIGGRHCAAALFFKSRSCAQTYIELSSTFWC